MKSVEFQELVKSSLERRKAAIKKVDEANDRFNNAKKEYEQSKDLLRICNLTVETYEQQLINEFIREVYDNIDVKKVYMSRFFFYVEKQISKRWICLREGFYRHPLVIDNYFFKNMNFNAKNRTITFNKDWKLYLQILPKLLEDIIQFFSEKEFKKPSSSFAINKGIHVINMIRVAIYFDMRITYEDFTNFCRTTISEKRFYELKKQAELSVICDRDRMNKEGTLITDSIAKIKADFSYFQNYEFTPSVQLEIRHQRIVRKTVEVLRG